MKTTELEGPHLDWAVAKAMGMAPKIELFKYLYTATDPAYMVCVVDNMRFSPHKDWEIAGPLLAEMVEGGEWGVEPYGLGEVMVANNNSEGLPYNGDWEKPSIDIEGRALLTTVLRAYVTWRLGDTVEVPA